ncbi:MAG TPA: hypothetical protein VKV96_07830 [Roseiarcus sp.]|nr:hypothetical protein [Roseiarcus sp.]
MVPASRASDVKAVDAFLEEVGKTLQGAPPPWIPGRDGIELMAIWNIEDSLGIVRAHLRFRVDPQNRSYPSVSLIFRNNSAWRIDLEASTVCKPNPLWAQAVGAPSTVCGSHCHSWPDNRDHILGQELWELPCRSPLPPQVRRLPQAVLWLAERVNLTLSPDQRDFDVPPQASLL